MTFSDSDSIFSCVLRLELFLENIFVNFLVFGLSLLLCILGSEKRFQLFDDSGHLEGRNPVRKKFP